MTITITPNSTQSDYSRLATAWADCVAANGGDVNAPDAKILRAEYLEERARVFRADMDDAADDDARRRASQQFGSALNLTRAEPSVAFSASPAPWPVASTERVSRCPRPKAPPKTPLRLFGPRTDKGCLRKQQGVPAGMKFCSGCKRIRPRSEFTADKSRADGLRYYCTPCRHEAALAQRNRVKCAYGPCKVRFQKAPGTGTKGRDELPVFCSLDCAGLALEAAQAELREGEKS